MAHPIPVRLPSASTTTPTTLPWGETCPPPRELRSWIVRCSEADLLTLVTTRPDWLRDQPSLRVACFLRAAGDAKEAGMLWTPLLDALASGPDPLWPTTIHALHDHRRPEFVVAHRIRDWMDPLYRVIQDASPAAIDALLTFQTRELRVLLAEHAPTISSDGLHHLLATDHIGLYLGRNTRLDTTTHATITTLMVERLAADDDPSDDWPLLHNAYSYLSERVTHGHSLPTTARAISQSSCWSIPTWGLQSSRACTNGSAIRITSPLPCVIRPPIVISGSACRPILGSDTTTQRSTCSSDLRAMPFSLFSRITITTPNGSHPL